jgi:hypothetical protein
MFPIEDLIPGILSDTDLVQVKLRTKEMAHVE